MTMTAPINKLLAMVLLLVSTNAYSCRFHAGGESLDGPILPGSSDIVLQSYLAERTGEIEPIERMEGPQGFRRVSWWLNLLSQQLEAKDLNDLHIVIVDAQMWSKVGTGAQLSLSLDIEIPEDRSNTLMLSEASLAAIVSQKITFKQALELRIVQVHQDRSRVIERLHSS